MIKIAQRGHSFFVGKCVFAKFLYKSERAVIAQMIGMYQASPILRVSVLVLPQPL